MIEITPQQRRALRAQAHPLHPVVSVGQAGLTPRVLHEIDVALRAHGLVKVRVFSDDRAQREAMLAQVAHALDAAPVQHLGKLLIVWRPQEETIEAGKPVRRRKTAKPPPRKTSQPLQPVARRVRGGGTDGGRDDRSRSRAHAPAEATRSASRRAPRGKSAPNPRRRRSAG
jgi:putative YhbY family RNA-binding protein